MGVNILNSIIQEICDLLLISFIYTLGIYD